MPFASLLTLLDDIASTLDDVALMTKVATKKTAGVLGDDLALNAQQVTGLNADRELPIVWAVAKGSAINKVILVPTAFAVSQVLPWLVNPLLMAGGLFLCFEGFEKIYEKLHHCWAKSHSPGVAPVETIDEHARIRGAVRTDFVLSAEIVVISLGTVNEAPWLQQLSVLTAVAAVMTIGVYGAVALIVKLDDLGLYLTSDNRTWLFRKLGGSILFLAPLLMRFLGIAGTIAMFMVGGGILVHGIPYLHHIQMEGDAWLSALLAMSTGFVAGGMCVVVWLCIGKLRSGPSGYKLI